jgi:hypothetical protein
MDLFLLRVISNSKSIAAGLRSERLQTAVGGVAQFEKFASPFTPGDSEETLTLDPSLHLTASERPALGATPRRTGRRLLSRPPRVVSVYHQPPISRFSSSPPRFHPFFLTTSKLIVSLFNHNTHVRRTYNLHPFYIMDYSTGKKPFTGMVSTTATLTGKRAMLTITRSPLNTAKVQSRPPHPSRATRLFQQIAIQPTRR